MKQALFDEIFRGKHDFPDNESLWPEHWKKTHYKVYERSLSFPYDKAFGSIFDNNTSLPHLLERRHSLSLHENNMTHTLSRNILHALCYFTCGVKENNGRSYPSAGALYPIEVYFFNAIESDDFARGLYHFSQVTHELTLIKKDNESTVREILGTEQVFVDSLTGVFIYTYTPARNGDKYGWFGARSAFLEVGAIGQNIDILAQSIGHATRYIGFTGNKKTDSYLEIDGYNELSVIALGIA